MQISSVTQMFVNQLLLFVPIYLVKLTADGD